jgi:transposase-like protein
VVSTLSVEEEAIVVGFRRHMQLPLDDCLHALLATIPQLSRSVLHRCFQRHGVNRRQSVPERPRARARKPSPIGRFRVAIAEVRTAQGKVFLFMAIDPVSKWLYTQMHTQPNGKAAVQFLNSLARDVPYDVHSVLTDECAPFAPVTETRQHRSIQASMFGYACHQRGIRHLLRSYRVTTFGEHVRHREVQSFQFRTRAEARQRAQTFLAAYRFGRRLKSLGGMTPYAFLCKLWSQNPQRFWANPYHHQWDRKHMPHPPEAPIILA